VGGFGSSNYQKRNSARIALIVDNRGRHNVVNSNPFDGLHMGAEEVQNVL
jgi:hypothetical protein